MGWASGIIDGREVGYGIEAACDEEGCEEKIDRGLAYRCGGYPEEGCNGYYCLKHLSTVVGGLPGFWCRRCLDEPRCECSGALDEAMYEDGSTEVVCPACDD